MILRDGLRDEKDSLALPHLAGKSSNTKYTNWERETILRVFFLRDLRGLCV
jgi:hypothetical protein